MEKVKHKTAYIALVVILPLIIFPAGFFWSNLWGWLVISICMIGFLLAIGILITNRFSGILIDERFYMTLSRFQLVIWTIIVLSAFLTIALGRVNALLTEPSASDLEPLAIALPAQLWALLGISTTSLVGSPLILNTKKDKKPANAVFYKEKEACINDKIKDEPELIAANNKIEMLLITASTREYKDAVKKRDNIKKKLSSKFEVEAERKIDAEFKNFGLLAYKRNINEAEFSDMFKGDEQGNKPYIDMAKVQMFFFTIIIAFTYLAILLTLIHTEPPMNINNFPPLDDGLVALLGISAGGFLGNKIYDHTKTQQ